MSTQAKLSAERRTSLGTSNSRRLRAAGQVPANVYGLGKEPVSITLCGEALKPLALAGAHVVDLELDGAVEKAFIRDIQWDTFLTHVLHVDFQRVDADARVDVELTVEVRGTVNEGVLDVHLHTIEVNCPVYDIPEHVEVRVGTLKLGSVVTVADLGLPASATVNQAPDAVVLKVVSPQEVEIVQDDMTGPVEPELIGAKKDADDEE